MTKEKDTPSFARDIQPLFRLRDHLAMRWAFDLGNYHDVSKHAEAILVQVQESCCVRGSTS